MVWYSHLFKNFPQFVVIHIVKGFEEGDDRGYLVGWHHRLEGREFDPTPGDGEGQGSLACCTLQGHKESDTLSD